MRNFEKTEWILFFGTCLTYFMFEIAFVLFGVHIYQNGMSTVGTMKYVKIFASFGVMTIGLTTIAFTAIKIFETILEQIHIYKYIRS